MYDQTFSAFQMDPVHGWVATHRLPFESAVYYCQEARTRYPWAPVAMVPDRVDPRPYLDLIEKLAYV